MKISLLLALVGFVLSFALPTFAQQPTPDLQLRQLVVALVKKYDAAINANDATAVAAFYTEDAIYVPDTGPINGREAIEKSFAHLKRNPRTGEVELSNPAYRHAGPFDLTNFNRKRIELAAYRPWRIALAKRESPRPPTFEISSVLHQILSAVCDPSLRYVRQCCNFTGSP